MGNKEFGTIIQIGDILVSEDVVLEFFSCDYQQCRGRCCIIGDSGAPLDEDEDERLERDYDGYKALMTEEGRQAIREKGFLEVDIQNDVVTPLAPDGSCAFCHFPGNGDCLCAIEKAGFRKPVSCSLYPVRVTRFNGGGLALNLHRWDICKEAFEKGKRENVRVYQFLKRPLTENFGEEFYEALEAAAEHLLS